jgi:hypothetical protein
MFENSRICHALKIPSASPSKPILKLTKHKEIFTFAYTIFRCVILTNVLYTYRQNTTVVLDVVYLFIGLRYMFRPLLGHNQALWRYIV